MAGTAEDDAFDGVGGDDVLTGGAGNDTLLRWRRQRLIDGGSGTNIVSGGAGSDRSTSGRAPNALGDTLADLNGDTIAGFGSDDGLDIRGVSLGRADLNIVEESDGVTISVGSASFKMTGDFSGGDFLTVARGTGDDAHTLVTFVPFLPSLTEGVHVDTASINGVASDPFLFGDGSVRFSLELKSAAVGVPQHAGRLRGRRRRHDRPCAHPVRRYAECRRRRTDRRSRHARRRREAGLLPDPGRIPMPMAGCRTISRS